MKFNDMVKHFEELDAKKQSDGRRVLNKEQSHIFKNIIGMYKMGGIAVVDGQAGSGKSVLISAIKKHCDSNNISCAVTASTGKAASALDGVTIHSYIGLSMKENNNAQALDEALVLGRNDDGELDMPDILIVDESSMIGMKLLNEILATGFDFIVFIGDSSQLNPVKDVKVEWNKIAQYHFKLTQIMRTSNPVIAKVFDDYRRQKNGEISGLDIFDYEDGKNIISIDYQEIGTLPANSLCTFVGYRNKLVEKMANKLTDKDHTIFNLNVGVGVTALEVEREADGTPVKQENGYFKRNFVNKQAFFNGEDVEIIEISDVTNRLVDKGYAKYGKWYLKLTKKGIMITNSEDKVLTYDNEGLADKYFISFPQDEVLEYCTLSVIEGNTFTLVWDGSEDEFDGMLEYYFSELYPWLRKYQVIQAHYRGKDTDLSLLSYDVREVLEATSKMSTFLDWYNEHPDTSHRKLGWKNLLTAKGVTSARPSVSRTIHKAQGISVPAVIIGEDSFYGASDNAKYVGVSRAKHGIILVKNTPTDWK